MGYWQQSRRRCAVCNEPTLLGDLIEIHRHEAFRHCRTKALVTVEPGDLVCVDCEFPDTLADVPTYDELLDDPGDVFDHLNPDRAGL